MFAAYVKEREGKDVIVHPHGFIIYQINPANSAVVLSNLFVRKAHRNTGAAKALCTELFARCAARGITDLYGEIRLLSPSGERIEEIVLAQGATWIGDEVDGLRTYHYKIPSCYADYAYVEHPACSMTTMFAEYLEERKQAILTQHLHGFTVHRVVDVDGSKVIYLGEIYVTPEYYRSGYAARMVDVVAARGIEQGCTRMVGSVCTDVNGVTELLKALLGYGMRFAQQDKSMLYFDKNIGG